MQPVAAAAASSTTDTKQTTTDKTTSAAKTPAAKDFASYLKDGEQLQKVADHAGYEQIDGGKRDGEYLNVTANKRSGEAFKIETVKGKILHVYGDLRIVVGTTDQAKATTTASSGGTAAPTA